MFTPDTIARPSTDISYGEWTRVAEACLRVHWPASDGRALRGIAIELFSDPHRGRLDPHEAVELWMQPMRR